MSARLRLPRPVLWISSEKFTTRLARGINEENLRAVFSRQRNDRPLNRAGHAAPRANGTFDGEYETAICGLSSASLIRRSMHGAGRPEMDVIPRDVAVQAATGPSAPSSGNNSPRRSSIRRSIWKPSSAISPNGATNRNGNGRGFHPGSHGRVRWPCAGRLRRVLPRSHHRGAQAARRRQRRS